MPSPSAPDKRYFLNRLALEHACDPLTLDPYWVLKQLYSDTPLEEMQELFAEFCEAAIAPTYNWKAKTPGSLVRFAEEMEQLIEACFLLSPKTIPKGSPESPAPIIRRFFKDRNLAGWKQLLHDWMMGALSGCSVAEIVEPENLLPFVQQMEKLIAAIPELLAAQKP